MEDQDQKPSSAPSITDGTHRAFFEHAPEPLIIHQDGRIVGGNRAAVALVGAPHGEMLIGRSVVDFVTPDDRDEVLGRIGRMARTLEAAQPLDTRILRLDGQSLPVEVVTTPVETEDGIVLQTSVRDISRRLQNEEELRQAKERWKGFTEQAPDGVFVARWEGRFVEVNERACEMTGFSREQLLEMNPRSLVADDSLDQNQVDWQRLGEGDVLYLEQRLRHADGSSFPAEVSVRRTGDGFATAVVRDVTERKQTEAARRESEELFRTLVDLSFDAIFVETVRGEILRANSSACEMFGYSEDELRNLRLHDLVEESFAAQLPDVITEDTGGVALERVNRRRDGSLFPSEVSTKLVNIGGEERLIAYIRDITERKETERELAEREARYRALVAGLPDLIMRLDRQGVYFDIHAPDEALLIRSRAELLGRSLAEFLDPPLASRFLDAIGAALETKRTQHLEYSLDPPGEETKHFEARVSPLAEDQSLAVIRDVTDRRRAEDRLRASERRFRLLAEHAQDVIFLYRIRPERRFEYVSPSVEHVLGYTPQQHYDDPDLGLSVVHPDDQHLAAELMDGKESDHPVVVRWLRADGGVVHVEQRVTVVRDEDGFPTALEGIARDITARVEAEAAAREADERYRRLVEQAIAGVYLIQDGRFAYVNPRFAEVFGYTQEEVLALPRIVDVVCEEDRHLVAENVRRRMAGEVEEARYTFRGKRKDGSVVHVEVHGRTYEQDGRPIILGMLLDVTARVKQQERMRLLQAAVSQANDGVMITEAETADKPVVAYVNAAFEEMTGYTASEAVGRTPDFLAGPETDLEVIQRMYSVLPKGESFTGELLVYRRDGTPFYQECAIGPVLDAHGRPRHFVAIMRDVTARKRNQQALVAAKERAEEMTRLKDAFLANMSHEIRTPLAAIIGAADMLFAEVSGESHELVEFVRRGGERLMDTLNSVLDLAQLQGGSMELQASCIDPVHEARRTLSIFNPQAQQQGLDLRLKTHGDADVRLLGDRAALGRVLSNLVSNAIKFTEEGSVTVRIVDGEEFVTIEVEDTGIGISEEFLPHLFEEFRQESTGHARGYEGNGLGLSITKRLVELMGGEIEAHSAQGLGTTFTVRLPACLQPSADGEDEPAEGTERAGKRRLLLVDDDPVIRRFVAQMLSEVCDVHTTASAEEALTMADEMQFDVAFVDINLKEDTSGEDVLRSLRSMSWYAETPIVALTAYALPGDEERFLGMGFDGYVAKPFRQVDLLRCLDEMLSDA